MQVMNSGFPGGLLPVDQAVKTDGRARAATRAPTGPRHSAGTASRGGSAPTRRPATPPGANRGPPFPRAGRSLVYAGLHRLSGAADLLQQRPPRQARRTATSFVGLENFSDILTHDPVFWKAVGNTAIFSVVGTVADVAGGLVLALVLFAGAAGAGLPR